MDESEQERTRVLDYLQKLPPEQREKMSRMMTRDLDDVRAASPNSKRAVRDAFQAQRFMRDFKKDR